MLNHKIIAVIFVAIMLLCFVISPSLAKASATTASSPSIDSNISQLARLLDNKYIGILGLQSEITNVKSQVSISQNSVIGYEYSGYFSTGDKNYSIAATQFNATIGNQTLTTFKEKIEGTSNCSTSVIANETTLGNTIIREINWTVVGANSTRDYFFNLESKVILSSDETEILAGTAQIYENVFGNPTQYSATFIPKIDDKNANIAITSKNDDQSATIDDDQVVDTLLDDLPWEPMYVPNQGNQGCFHLDGLYIYWPSGASVLAGPILTILGAVFTLVSIVGITVLVVGVVLDEAAFFPAQLGEYEETIQYWELMYYNLYGTLIPIYYETGYYSNYYYAPPLNNWQKIPCPWTYFAIDGTFGVLEIEITILTGGHTDPWPLLSHFIDPPVTIIAYDESANTVIYGIPIYIDGNYAGRSGDTIFVPEGTYDIQLTSDSFHYFDIYGNTVYDNPATVTFSGTDEVIITGYYYSIPTYTLTVYAYDAYLGPDYSANPDVYVDGNYVGTIGTEPISVEVPVGDHTITVDYRAYCPMWPAYGTIYEINGDFNGYYSIYSETPVTVFLWVYYDSTVNAVYSVW